MRVVVDKKGGIKNEFETPESWRKTPKIEVLADNKQFKHETIMAPVLFEVKGLKVDKEAVDNFCEINHGMREYTGEKHDELEYKFGSHKKFVEEMVARQRKLMESINFDIPYLFIKVGFTVNRVGDSDDYIVMEDSGDKMVITCYDKIIDDKIKMCNNWRFKLEVSTRTLGFDAKGINDAVLTINQLHKDYATILKFNGAFNTKDFTTVVRIAKQHKQDEISINEYCDIYGGSQIGMDRLYCLDSIYDVAVTPMERLKIYEEFIKAYAEYVMLELVASEAVYVKMQEKKRSNNKKKTQANSNNTKGTLIIDENYGGKKYNIQINVYIEDYDNDGIKRKSGCKERVYRKPCWPVSSYERRLRNGVLMKFPPSIRYRHIKES